MTVVSDTQLTVVVPNGAATGRISVTHPSDGTGTSAGDFTVPIPAPPGISSISPQYGPPGSSVTLEGTNLSSANVRFSGFTNATITSNTATQLVVTVPAAARSGAITVITAAGSTSSPGAFTVLATGAPTLSSFTPATGGQGTSVTLTGTNFRGLGEVTFNGVPVSSFSASSDTSLTVTVPVGASTGPIRLYNPLGSAVSAASFTVKPAPKVTSFTPMAGAPGTKVTLSGENFTSVSTVAFNSRPASFTVVSPTQITATVPPGASTGPLSVYTSNGNTTTQTRFSVLSSAPPVISGFTPASINSFTQVTVTGTHFTGTQEVTLNGQPVISLSTSSDTSLSFYVSPGNHTTGPIRVTNTAGSTLSSTDLTVVPPAPPPPAPVVSGFSPASGTNGAVVALTGSGFTGATAVRFNGVPAQSFTVVDDTHLSAVVPAGAATGKLTVVKSGVSGASTSEFVVEGAAPPVITSFSPTSGTGTVQLQGAYFTGVTSVKFNGVNAGYFSVEGDGRISAYTPFGSFTTGRITVTNSAGTGTSAQDFVVLPVPTVSSMTPTSGPPGTVVTLTGTGFSRLTSVSMSKTAVFKVLSDTTLEVIVPRGTPSSTVITLTTGSGQGSSPKFTVTAEVAPVITSFTPETGFTNTYVTLYGSGFSGATEVSFNGVSASSFAVQSDGQLTVSAPYLIETGPILVRNAAGSATTSTPFVVPALPEVSGFSPASGTAGTSVTLHGTGFSQVQSVHFAKSLAASFFVLSDTELTAIVPSGAVNGPISVSISPYANRVPSPESFTVTSTCTPTITSFTPSQSGINRAVNITGTCFTGTTAIRFGGVDVEVFNIYSDTSMGVQVPPGAVTGPISVVNTLGTGSSAESFTVIPPPSISSFTPNTGEAGTVVTLTGTGLATTSSVSLNGSLNASFSVVSDTEVAVTIPPGATTGRFSLSTTGGSATSSRSFIVKSLVAPAVTSFSPGGGGGNTLVQVTGSGFTGATAVRFNGYAVYQFYVVSDTRLDTYVPTGARTGPITVENTAGTGTSSESFTVPRPPTVAVFSPVQGQAGTAVTIEGSGFTGATKVLFSSFDASFTVVSDTRIIATVPSGSTSGQLTIYAPSGYAGSSDSFSVLSTAAPTITGISPASGTSNTLVTIKGTGFTGATRVSFNGVETTSVYPSSDTEIRIHPPLAVTTGPVAVTNSVGTATSPTHFTVLPSSTQPRPVITDFSPASGPPGTVVTINGTGFTKTQYVIFEGTGHTSPKVTVVSDTQLTATVPSGATTGTLAVQNSAGRGASSGGSFTVLSAELPVLDLFSPLSGRPGSEVRLMGSGFTGTTRVALNGLDLQGFRVSSDQELRVTLPPGATSGTFTVQNTLGEASSLSSFTVLPPVAISSFTPAAGGAGTRVTLTGTGFTNTYSVRFSGTEADFTVVSDTEISAVVPGAATSGSIYLLPQQGLAAVSKTAFEVTANGAPALASFTPGSGAVGSKVLLTGTNFSGLTDIRFNGIAAAMFKVHTDTLAVVQVPYGASTGLLQVTNGQGSASSAASFTVLKPGTITSFTPASGAAGTEVTLTGSGFTGTTSVLFENGVAGFTVDHDGRLRATVPTGAVSGVITVTGPGGTFQTASWFRIPSSRAPAVTSLGPPRLGVGQTVTVSGTGFTGATAVRINGTPVESFRITSDTQIRAVVSSHATTGPVSVTTDLGTGVSTSPLTIVPTPVISSFTPASGAAGTQVTVTGTGFTEVTSVSFGGLLSGTGASFTVVSDTQLIATVPAEALPGPIRIRSTGGIGVSPASFSMQASTAPVIHSLTPAAGNVGSLVLIRGKGLSGASVRFNGVQTNLPITITSDYLYVAVPPGATTGRVTMTNSFGTATSLEDFTINSSHLSVSSVVPNKAPRGAVVTIHGTNLHQSTVSFIGTSTRAAELRSSSATRLEVVVPPEATSGIIYVSKESSAAVAAFTVEEPPSGRSVNPPSGSIDSSTTITLTGSNFEPGATVTFGGVAATSVTYVSETELRVVVPERSTGGAVDIQIRNPTGLTSVLREGFTYIGPSPAPTVSSVAPSSGPATGGTSVTVTGTGFLSGAAVKFSGTAATNVAVINDTTLVCTTPALPPGSSTVTVTNVDGQSGALAHAFTFIGPPEVTTVAPTSGTSNGGTIVTLEGSGFREGAGVLVGGSPATNVTVESSTRLTATTPAHAAGVVDVIVRNSDNQSGTLMGGYTYVSPAAPSVTAISPGSGPSTGGTLVTITGTGFVNGSQVKVGGVAATSVTYVSATQLTAVTGAHAAGPVNVDVTNPDGSAGTLTGGYTYEPDPAPALTGITPGRGPTSGGTTVTLTGAHFKSGATVLFGGTAGTVTQLSATSLTVKTPARGSIGAVDVVVRNPDQQTATLLGGFTYDWGASPGVSSVTPGHGSAAGGTSITVHGTGFVAGATVTLGGTAATQVNVVSPTQLTAVTAPRASGTVSVVVKNTDNQSGTLDNGYTYDPLPVLTVASVSPNNGPASGGTRVTLTGTNFVDGASVKFGSVEAASVTFVSSTSLTAVTAPQTAGTVGVTVTNPDGESASLSSAYTYNPAPAPTVSNITPGSGPSTGGTPVTINGAHFVDGVTVTFDGMAATSVTFGSSTSLTAVTPPHAAGAVTVVVKNPDDLQASVADGFTYIAPPAPSVTSLTPTSGLSTGGTQVTINGAHFVDGATVKFGTLPATSVSFGSGSSLTAIAPAQAVGTVSVTVINPDGQSGTLSNAYTYTEPPKLTVTSINPSSGVTNGGTDVTLNGTEFAQGATVLFGGVPATGAVVASSVSISARTPAHLAGKVDVVVRNPDGKQATLSNGFTYVPAPAPTISQLSPNTGASEGGLTVTITGTNFVPGATVKFGSAAGTNTRVDSSTSITTTTPAMAAGSVMVSVTNPDGQLATKADGFTYQTKAPDSGGGCSTGGEGLTALALVSLLVTLGRHRRLRR
jgi:hypothetical protein